VRVLIANRGEIAVRIIRACREMGLSTVAVYSDCDRDARHVRDADIAVHIGPNDARSSYLNIEAILSAARATNADAVHPGYGFLAENAAFAKACDAAGVTFIGPSADAIALMGSKTAARTAAKTAGVPVVPGAEAPLPAGADPGELGRAAAAVGFPLMVKAVAGGGGKGMRVVESASGLLTAVQTARSEAGSAFGDTAVYLERRLTRPRHIEIQLLGDHHGTIVPFVERECSIQRRHQKVVEESPSQAVTQPLRERMGAAAAAVAKSVGYTNAGTIEFLLDEDGSFFFLEMNTRLQVEHPVTEMVADVDLVQWQIRIARGERLDLDPARALTANGHAIECRIYAEDPVQDFLPQAGQLLMYREPAGPGIRVDAGVVEGGEVSVFYDPMLAKLIVHGETRELAIARMANALRRYVILGIRTNIPFLLNILASPEFVSGDVHTGFLDAEGVSLRGTHTTELPPAAVAALALHREAPVSSSTGGSRTAADPFQTIAGWGVR
jgi:acetyl-CoA carboxylase biotin carboxylase subunit